MTDCPHCLGNCSISSAPHAYNGYTTEGCYRRQLYFDRAGRNGYGGRTARRKRHPASETLCSSEGSHHALTFFHPFSGIVLWPPGHSNEVRSQRKFYVRMRQRRERFLSRSSR